MQMYIYSISNTMLINTTTMKSYWERYFVFEFTYVCIPQQHRSWLMTIARTNGQTDTHHTGYRSQGQRRGRKPQRGAIPLRGRSNSGVYTHNLCCNTRQSMDVCVCVCVYEPLAHVGMYNLQTSTYSVRLVNLSYKTSSTASKVTNKLRESLIRHTARGYAFI